jgi:hypothetical protein
MKLLETARSAFNGRYQVIGDPRDADCVVGQSFGASEDGPGHTNEQLAQFIDDHPVASNRPLILQQEVAEAFRALQPDTEIDHVIVGDPSDLSGGGLDSWEMLWRSIEYMQAHDLERPMIVAQAHHVGRVAMQAVRLGLNPIIPEGLPAEFDKDSTQIWTRSRGLWVMRELPGLAYLRAKDKL